MVWKTLCEIGTKFPADSFEWCPFEKYGEFFTCGMYYLVEGGDGGSQDRIGMLGLMCFVDGEVKIVQEIELDGVLDVKWCLEEVGNRMLVAGATARGDVHVFQFTGNCLIELDTKRFGEHLDDYMVLAVNWKKISDTEAKICVTDNKGFAGVLLYSDGKLEIVDKWNAHSLEAWTIAFDANCSEILYTGGDDAKLKIWDRRSEETKTIRSQDTGLTIIHTNSYKPNSILTGSFDEILNKWDTRTMQKPVDYVKCSGGLWRIKCTENFILTANIYGGFQIIDWSTMKILGWFTEHASLAYGADWGPKHGNSVLVGTCSFYDKKLCISAWEP